MGIVKDIFLVFGGSMLGVTVMCLMNASAAADRAMEKKGSDKMNFGQNLCATRSLVKS